MPMKLGGNWGVQSFKIPRQPAHLVQELNVGTVAFSGPSCLVEGSVGLPPVSTWPSNFAFPEQSDVRSCIMPGLPTH